MQKVLFVGSFKDRAADGSVGGQMYACTSLINSKISESIEWILLDTTGKSVPPPGLFIRLLGAIRRLWIFVFTLIFNRPDRVLIFAANAASFYEKGIMALLSSLFGIKVIFGPRGGPVDKEIVQSKFFKAFATLVFRKSHFIVCQGQYWKLFFCSLLAKEEEEKFVVIPNWLDISAYEFDLVKKNEDTLIVLFVGWIMKEKGVFDIFEASKILNKVRDKEVKFVFLGDGIAKDDLVAMVEARVYKDAYFEFPGWTYGNEKMNFLKTADVFVLPSYSEGMPNSLMEAMASGIASVSTEVGAVPDLIINGETGILTQPGDVNALAEALNVLLSDEVLREKLALNGKQRIIRNHSLGSAVDKFKKILA